MVQAHVLLTLSPGATDDVVRTLSGMDEVLEVSLVYGGYDALAKVEVNTLEELSPFVIKIRDSVPHIQSTTTLIKA
ncbi:MAG: Lrp/AsnC family transcriptional regulator [Candidatus Diapherotrites archaeon]|nr:Lrp/AsnC family transcriptional regulator [Candidatus Diapherotrites archaeon]